jgi:uncharacterized membrane protein (GlpM family)
VIVALALKALAGAVFVTLFALIGETLSPKQVSGIFGAAPSVALASLLVTLGADGSSVAHDAAIGMAAGAVAMVAYWAVIARTVDDHGALLSSVAAWSVWGTVAVAAFLVVR